MKRLFAIVISFVLCFLPVAACGEDGGSIIGAWNAVRLISDGIDMDLTGTYGNFISSNAVFDSANSFSIKTDIFGDITKSNGKYVATDDGVLTFYTDGILSAGSYRFEGGLLIIEETLSGTSTTLYLERTVIDKDEELTDELAGTTWILVEDTEVAFTFTADGVLYITGGNYDVETYLWRIEGEKLWIDYIIESYENLPGLPVTVENNSLTMTVEDSPKKIQLKKVDYALPVCSAEKAV